MNNTKYNITVIGAPGVGKSALTLRLLYQEFVDDYEPTKLDSYQTTMTVNNSSVEVQITDTAGQEDYASVRDTFLRNGEGFLCVFSITDTESFNHVQELFNQVKAAKGLSPPPFLIVGNKSDLESTRQIQREDAEKLAESLGVQYMETSAKTNSNVDDAFQRIILMEMEARTPMADAKDQNRKKKKGRSKGVRKFLCGLA